MGDNLSSSLLLLLVALVLLWLAVTDRLGRIIDAFQVIKGTSTITTSTSPGASAASVPSTAMLELPSLPALGRVLHVPA